MDRPHIMINVVGRAGTGKSSIALLLNDFLDHTGFTTEVNLLDAELMTDDMLLGLITSVPDRLEKMIERDMLITINEVQAPRDFK